MLAHESNMLRYLSVSWCLKVGDDLIPGGGLSSLVTLGIVAGASWAVILLVTAAYLCFWKMKFEKDDKNKYMGKIRSLLPTTSSILLHIYVYICATILLYI